jgi:steroid delta-isomerase-like uncharacterized protein
MEVSEVAPSSQLSLQWAHTLRWKRVGREEEFVSEENKALVRRYDEEVWNKGNLDVIEELFAPDYVFRDPASPEEVRGPEGVRQFVETYRKAFPDFQVTTDDQIAVGDKVVSRWTIRATHQGELLGIPPSGKRIEFAGITIDRIEGGKFMETWEIYDALGLMRQIGAIPEPGQGGS